MVKRALIRIAVIVAAGLASGSCQLVGLALASTFPAEVTQATARRDLSSLVSPSQASSFSMSDVTAGGREYNFIGFSASGNNFSYTQYYDTWLSTGTWTFPIRLAPGASTSFSVRAIFSDSDPARQRALFVLHDSGDGLDHYLVVPLGDLNGGTALKSPLLDFYQVFTKPASDPDLMGYSNGGVVRFVPGGPGAGAFVRSDLSGADRPTTLTYFTRPSVRQAFSPSGGTYFSFDLNTRIVTRLTAWWN